MSNHTVSTLYTPAELDKHEFFARTHHRKSRWYCTLCCRPEQAAVAHFDCRGAKKHESTQRHRDNVARVSQPAVAPWVDLNSWGLQPGGSGWDPIPAATGGWDAPAAAGPSKQHQTKQRKSATPFADLRIREDRTILNVRDAAMQKYKIRLWLKACVLAAGGSWIDTADDVEPAAPDIWWDVDQRNDNNWARTPTNPSINLPGHSDVASDQQMIAASEAPCSARSQDIDMDIGSNFSEPHPFVQKVADDEGWDPTTTRHRNAFYTLPTDEKVAQINDMIRMLASTA